MTSPRSPRRAPSWLGTMVVAVAVVVMCLRAAAELRRSVSPPTSPASTGQP